MSKKKERRQVNKKFFELKRTINAEELEQKAEKVFAWVYGILRERINFCDHSLGEESVYIQSFCVITSMLDGHLN